MNMKWIFRVSQKHEQLVNFFQQKIHIIKYQLQQFLHFFFGIIRYDRHIMPNPCSLEQPSFPTLLSCYKQRNQEIHPLKSTGVDISTKIHPYLLLNLDS